jgi:hypothetical protein
MKSENRHYEKVYKNKEHPAAKCKQPKCLVCSGAKVLKIPNKQQLIQKSKIKTDGTITE